MQHQCDSICAQYGCDGGLDAYPQDDAFQGWKTEAEGEVGWKAEVEEAGITPAELAEIVAEAASASPSAEMA